MHNPVFTGLVWGERASLCWMTGPPGVAVGCLGLPSLQHPLGELHATAGVDPAAGEAVVLAGEVVAAGEVLPPTMGVGVADDDVVEDAGVELLLVELALPNEPTMPDTIDIACRSTLWTCEYCKDRSHW